MPKLSSKDLPKDISKQDAEYLQKYGDKLSDSTRYAKWISNPDEHEDQPGQSLVTRNHDVIKQWAEERDARPPTVPDTEYGGHLGVLRFNFPGYGGRTLEEVDWDQWFKAFDERDLVMIYQEHLKNGNQSNFFRFDNPNRDDA